MSNSVDKNVPENIKTNANIETQEDKNVSENIKTNANSETQEFKYDADVEYVLKLVINSLYSHKEIFLRELLSNAADACQKMHQISLLSKHLLGDSPYLKIKISYDKEMSTITVHDNGIGMNRQDLLDHLGVIAKSGTRKFAKLLEESANKDKRNDGDLIGQFGVGFYSVFMVAQEVTVVSKKYDSEDVWAWRSSGSSVFYLEKSAEDISRGTMVTLKLKKDEKSYLGRIEELVSTYSKHISFPIEYYDEGKDDAPEQINKSPAIWTRLPKDITEEEHKQFFYSVAHVGGDPWMVFHNHTEGAVCYTNLLYIPSIKPFDLFHPDRRCSVQLYVKKIFISESDVDLLPQYMRFLKGIIDCNDLPLNVSRETLQHNKAVDKIKKSLTKKILKGLTKKAKSSPEEYVEKFWNNFGAVLKEGLCEYASTEDREALLKVCRFYSNKFDKMISIDEYVENMTQGQNCIFYLTSNNIDNAKKSPHLEGFAQKNVDVLLMTDSVDDFWVNVNQKYKSLDLKSIARSDIDIEPLGEQEEKEAKEAVEQNVDSGDDNKVISYIKETLGEKVADVLSSKKLCNSPVCLVVREGAMGIRMERFMLEQNQIKNTSSKILEVNVKHPVLKSLSANLNSDVGERIVRLLFDQACIAEGEPLSDLAGFLDNINYFLSDKV